VDSKKNVVVLTSGLAGSSVLAALLARAGYWTGESTVKKRDYNTWENQELVRLNRKILEDVGFDQDWTMTFDRSYVDELYSGFDGLDESLYADFAKQCNERAPWVWKDPRLWLTIRFWARFIDLSNTAFLLIRREPLQAWISTLNRRQIQTFAHCRKYRDGIYNTIVEFVRGNNLTYYEIVYEDLMVTPNRVIDGINQCLNTELMAEDFLAVFRGKAFRKQHGALDLLKALAIYLRNHNERLK